MSPRAGFDAKAFLAGLGHKPGVYRMYDASDRLIYVGKARDVHRRLSSYFGARPQGTKVMAMLRRLARIEVTWTTTEVEALLLESTLIKEHRPRYNVILRDDKSYPYIRLMPGLGFPRLSLYRGPHRAAGRLFGPYPNAVAARNALIELQRVFRLRNCTDRFFRNRSRPCLQYQIERCTAPCVGLIDQATYQQDMDQAVAFLEGRDEQVIEQLVARMEEASATLEFEKAARMRDQIHSLRRIRAHQDVIGDMQDCDVLAVAEAGRDTAVVVVLPVRGGRLQGSRNYRVAVGAEQDSAAIMEGFIVQHFEQEAPPRIVPDRPLPGAEIVRAAVSKRVGHEVVIRPAGRGALKRLTALAATNAQELVHLNADGPALTARFEALEKVLDLPSDELNRIECFDISHSGGEAAYGSCVVFDRQGPLKAAYRRFRIREASGGDDYAALEEVLERRYSRVLDEEGALPDLVLIDGGPGQLRRAQGVLERLGLEELRLGAVTKGAGRRAEFDRLILAPEGRSLALEPESAALHLVQSLRDEAHRFAISGHRRARQKTRSESVLDDVTGVGPVKRRQLLTRFGGLKGLRQASAVDLTAVPGINRALAERIVNHLAREGHRQ